MAEIFDDIRKRDELTKQTSMLFWWPKIIEKTKDIPMPKTAIIPMSKSEIFAPIVIIRDGKVDTFTEFEKDWNQSFINATKYLIEVAKGNKEPILSGEQAKNVLRFNLAAIKSSEIGKEVTLKEFN